MKDDIERRFTHNLERVESLVTAYKNALPGVAGRPPVAVTDILRASVVFLHATLEDLLRSVLAWKLPTAAPEHLEDVPLDGMKPRTRYTLSDMAAYRGQTVDDIIAKSVSSWLDRSNFNDVTEVASALTKGGVPKDEAGKILDEFSPYLEAMMKRRHWIVHRADRNDAQGSGQFAARSLNPEVVVEWRDSVRAFGDAILALL